MRYEFRANGDIKIVLSPENNLEREFFNLLSSEGGSSVVTVPNSDEITIVKNSPKKES